MKLIFLGPPGVGKGTHAEIISKRYEIPRISTGDILREGVKNGSELGLKAKKYMDEGGLVPDDIIISMLRNRLEKDDCRNGFILDGFPRTMAQAEALDKITQIDMVINSVASDKTIIERLTTRWTCRKCAAIYNTLYVPPKKEGICDRCGEELYQRDDQKEDVIKNRLKVYNEQTEPLINYYKKKELLVDVNAEGPKDEVAARMAAAIEKYFKK